MLGTLLLLYVSLALVTSKCPSPPSSTCAIFLEFHKRNILHVSCTPPHIQTNGTAARLCLLLLAGDISPNPGPPQQQCINLGFTNIRSIKNKSEALNHYINSHNTSIFAVTETWLREDETPALIAGITPAGYQLYHKPRCGRGGGVAFLVNKDINCTLLESPKHYDSFEHIMLNVVLPGESVNMACIYRPPSTNASFLLDFSDFICHLNSLKNTFLIVGDINIDPKSHNLSNKYTSLLEEFELKQHVDFLTHIQGNTLDHLITPESSRLIKSLNTSDCLSDHMVIRAVIDLAKPMLPKKTVWYRKFHKIDKVKLAENLNASELVKNPQLSSCEDLYHQYHNTLVSLLDKHAPLCSKLEGRPSAKWLTDNIFSAKRQKRYYERKWRRTHSSQDRSNYRKSINTYNRLIKKAKQTFYTKTIEENSHDSKNLWKNLNAILHRNPVKVLPSFVSAQNLANSFSSFFVDKIKNIRSGFPKCSSRTNSPNEKACNLSTFNKVSENDVRKVVMASPTKSCTLDPWPTSLVKDHIESLITPITNMVNLSLKDGVFPDTFKKAIVTPLIKKPTLNKEDMKNYRPVSGLNFISKVIERVVAKQVKQHLVSNELDNKFQSAYKTGHSTETTLLKIKNDIHQNLAKNLPTALVLLDLSAAFDTIDHSTLLERLASHFGFAGSALKWFRSYLADRVQSVKIGDILSNPVSLDFGVPQGSVLGPVLFTLYTTPLSGIITKYVDICHHLYADDTQVYIAITPKNATTAIPKLQSCLKDIQLWMAENKLKLNPDKTEFIIIGSKQQQSSLKQFLPVDILGNQLNPTEKVRNLGVIFDSEFKFSSHINNTCKSCYYHIRDLARIRGFLPKSAAITLANALVSSRIDYCNSLLNSILDHDLKKLQRVQNSLARIVFKKSRYCHTTPLLRKLHWLPIKYRIIFKQCLLVFKTISFGAPTYFKDILIPYTCQTNTRRSKPEKMLLKVPAFKRRIHKSVTHFDAAFSVCGPNIWNSLPIGLRGAKTVSSFRSGLKTHLYKLAFPP